MPHGCPPLPVLPLSRRRFSIIIKCSARVADKTLWRGFYAGKIVDAGEKNRREGLMCGTIGGLSIRMYIRFRSSLMIEKRIVEFKSR